MTARDLHTVPVVTFTVRGEKGAGNSTCEYTVVYDGSCKVCTRSVNVLRKWDREQLLEIVPYQTPGVMARFPWIPTEAFSEALQLIHIDGRTWSGAEAIERLLDVLPRGKFLSWVFRIPLVRTIADKLYRWFARHRYRLGCGDHCTARRTDATFDDK